MFCNPIPYVGELRAAGTWTLWAPDAKWPHNTALMFSLISVGPDQPKWHSTGWSHSEPSPVHYKHCLSMGELSVWLETIKTQVSYFVQIHDNGSHVFQPSQNSITTTITITTITY